MLYHSFVFFVFIIYMSFFFIYRAYMYYSFEAKASSVSIVFVYISASLVGIFLLLRPGHIYLAWDFHSCFSCFMIYTYLYMLYSLFAYPCHSLLCAIYINCLCPHLTTSSIMFDFSRIHALSLSFLSSGLQWKSESLHTDTIPILTLNSHKLCKIWKTILNYGIAKKLFWRD